MDTSTRLRLLLVCGIIAGLGACLAGLNAYGKSPDVLEVIMPPTEGIAEGYIDFNLVWYMPSAVYNQIAAKDAEQARLMARGREDVYKRMDLDHGWLLGGVHWIGPELGIRNPEVVVCVGKNCYRADEIYVGDFFAGEQVSAPPVYRAASKFLPDGRPAGQTLIIVGIPDRWATLFDPGDIDSIWVKLK